MDRASDELCNAEIAQTIKARMLDQIPFSFGIRVPISWVGSVDVTQFVDYVAEKLAVRVNFHIPGRQVLGHRAIPRTWWDAFKIEKFPQWLLNQFPARYEYLEVEIHNHLYPGESAEGTHYAKSFYVGGIST